MSDTCPYRYRLTRKFDTGVGIVAFVMLNPSTADDEKNDPTIRRCIGFASRLGCAELRVVNLFAKRSTNPRGLIGEPPSAPQVGELGAWRWAFSEADFVIAAWGAHGGELGRMVKERAGHVLEVLREHGLQPFALALSQKGHPKHPLYLRADSDLVPYYPEGAR